MLKTHYKSKLPRGWSYPIGAQVLSDAFEDIDGAAERPLCFQDHGMRIGRHSKAYVNDKPYTIIKITYWTPYIDHDIEYMISKGQFDQWQIRVSPVPSDKVAPIRRCVIALGLPRVREWLKETRVLEACQGRGHCRLLYDESNDRLLLQSSLNNFDKMTEAELSCAQ